MGFGRRFLIAVLFVAFAAASMRAGAADPLAGTSHNITPVRAIRLGQPPLEYAGGSYIRSEGNLMVVGLSRWSGAADSSERISTVSLFDISQPTQPALMHEMNLTYGLHLLQLQGSLLFLGSTQQVFIWDVSAPATPVLKSTISRHGYFFYLAPLVVTESPVGLVGFRIYDLTNPASPVLLYNSENTAKQYSGVNLVRGNFVYCYGGSTPYVLDITSPSQPVEVGIWSPRLIQNGLLVFHGNFAVDCFGHIFDFQNPLDPVLLATWNSIDTSRPVVEPDRLLIRNGLVYAATSNELVVVDKNRSEEIAPQVGWHRLPQSGQLALSGDIIYLLDGCNRLLHILRLQGAAVPAVSTKSSSAERDWMLLR